MPTLQEEARETARRCRIQNSPAPRFESEQLDAPISILKWTSRASGKRVSFDSSVAKGTSMPIGRHLDGSDSGCDPVASPELSLRSSKHKRRSRSSPTKSADIGVGAPKDAAGAATKSGPTAPLSLLDAQAEIETPVSDLHGLDQSRDRESAVNCSRLTSRPGQGSDLPSTRVSHGDHSVEPKACAATRHPLAAEAALALEHSPSATNFEAEDTPLEQPMSQLLASASDLEHPSSVPQPGGFLGTPSPAIFPAQVVDSLRVDYLLRRFLQEEAYVGSSFPRVANETRVPIWCSTPATSFATASGLPFSGATPLVDSHWKRHLFDHDPSPALFTASRSTSSHINGFKPTKDFFTLLPAADDLLPAVGADHRPSSQGLRLTSSLAPSGRHLANGLASSPVGLDAAVVGVLGTTHNHLGHSPPLVGAEHFVIDEPFSRAHSPHWLKLPTFPTRSEEIIFSSFRPHGIINVKTIKVAARSS